MHPDSSDLTDDGDPPAREPVSEAAQAIMKKNLEDYINKTVSDREMMGDGHDGAPLVTPRSSIAEERWDTPAIPAPGQGVHAELQWVRRAVAGRP